MHGAYNIASYLTLTHYQRLFRYEACYIRGQIMGMAKRNR